MYQQVTNKDEKKLSEQAKRVEKIRRILAENNNNVFAEKVGITPQLASAIVSGSKGVGRKLAEKILAAFPQVSRLWLYTGEGEMMVAGNVGENNSGNVATTGGSISTVDDRLVALLEKEHEERMRLLSIIEKLSDR